MERDEFEVSGNETGDETVKKLLINIFVFCITKFIKIKLNAMDFNMITFIGFV